MLGTSGWLGGVLFDDPFENMASFQNSMYAFGGGGRAVAKRKGGGGTRGAKGPSAKGGGGKGPKAKGKAKKGNKLRRRR